MRRRSCRAASYRSNGNFLSQISRLAAEQEDVHNRGNFGQLLPATRLETVVCIDFVGIKPDRVYATVGRDENGAPVMKFLRVSPNTSLARTTESRVLKPAKSQ